MQLRGQVANSVCGPKNRCSAFDFIVRCQQAKSRSFATRGGFKRVCDARSERLWRAVMAVRLPSQHRLVQPGQFGVLSGDSPTIASSGEPSSPLSISTRPRTAWAAAATRALNAAAPTATALARNPTSIVDERSGERRRHDRIRMQARTCHGCAFPPEGARIAAAATMSASAAGSLGLVGFGWRKASRGVGGSSISSRASVMSMRTRPDESSVRNPILRTASVTTVAPSATSPASCGQVVRVRPTSISDAAIRDDSRAASSHAQDVRNFVLLRQARQRRDVHIAQQAVQDRPGGSRSNRSTSTRPRSLVAIRTGRRRARAACRTRTFMSSESHSSTTNVESVEEPFDRLLSESCGRYPSTGR